MISVQLRSVAAMGVLALATVAVPAAQAGRASFITRMPTRLFIYPGERGYPRSECPDLRRGCLPVLAFGGVERDGLPTIEPAIKADIPHMRITMVLQHRYNEIVANGGVWQHATPVLYDEVVVADPIWTKSSAASVVGAGDGNGYVNHTEAGNTLDLPIVLYDALVFNACESGMPIPIEHGLTLIEGDPLWPPSLAEIGAFHALDESTIDSPGHYKFWYKVRATSHLHNGVSDLHWSGKIIAACSSLNELPPSIPPPPD